MIPSLQNVGKRLLPLKNITELLYLTNQIEQVDAKHIEQLAYLAQIRRIPLLQLIPCFA